MSISDFILLIGSVVGLLALVGIILDLIGLRISWPPELFRTKTRSIYPIPDSLPLDDPNPLRYRIRELIGDVSIAEVTSKPAKKRALEAHLGFIESPAENNNELRRLLILGRAFSAARAFFLDNNDLDAADQMGDKALEVRQALVEFTKKKPELIESVDMNLYSRVVRDLEDIELNLGPHTAD